MAAPLPIAPQALKRSLSSTLADDGKKARTDSFYDPRISQEVHEAINRVYESVLEIFKSVKAIPSAKWSTLAKHAEMRIQFFTQASAMIIENRRPGYPIQLSQSVEDEVEGVTLSMGSLPDADPPKDKQRFDKDKLLNGIAKLVARLKMYQTDLERTNLDLSNKEMDEYEDFVYKHYLTKVHTLSSIRPPEYLPSSDLLTKCPRSEFPIISKIEKHQLYQRPEIRASFEPLLEVAQKIHDHYQATWTHFAACENNLKNRRRLQDIFLTQLLEAKSERRYRDEAHAQLHLARVKGLCALQQQKYYLEPQVEWETAAAAAMPKALRVDPPLRCCQLDYVTQSHKGSRVKLPKDVIEDKVLVEEMDCTVSGQSIKLPLFAVMDGHGGDMTSTFCSRKLKGLFSREIEKNNPQVMSLHGMMNAGKSTCLKLQRDAPSISGSTLLFATLYNHKLYVFSVGDSRGLLLGDDVTALTCDATPKEPYFENKVILRHGSTYNDRGMVRVTGPVPLNMTNSIGEKMASQFFVHVPLINVISLDEVRAEYLLLASDGLSDVASDLQLFELFKEFKEEDISMQEMASSICRRAVASWNAREDKYPPRSDGTKVLMGDDVSLILVKLRNPRQKNGKIPNL